MRRIVTTALATVALVALSVPTVAVGVPPSQTTRPTTAAEMYCTGGGVDTRYRAVVAKLCLRSRFFWKRLGRDPKTLRHTQRLAWAYRSALVACAKGIPNPSPLIIETIHPMVLGAALWDTRVRIVSGQREFPALDVLDSLLLGPYTKRVSPCVRWKFVHAVLEEVEKIDV